jgi:hypothetical protein
MQSGFTIYSAELFFPGIWMEWDWLGLLIDGGKFNAKHFSILSMILVGTLEEIF